MKKLKRGDIRFNSDSRSYARGLSYFETGRVVSLQVAEETEYSVTLIAKVKGSGGRVYQQDIDLYWEDGAVDISGFCTCPVRYDCKHMVAACLQYQSECLAESRPAGNADAACLAWLDAFVSLSQGPQSQARGDEFLLYLLHPSHQPGRLKVSFRIVRPLKRGGLNKGRTAHLYNFINNFSAPRYLQPLDEEIGRMLGASAAGSWGDPQLAGELGFLALSKMLQSGRCHWRDTDSPPLRLGEERDLVLAWRQDKAGNAVLQASVAGGGQVLLVEPALYLDPDAHMAGSLTNAPYTSGQLEKLLDAPPVPAGLMAEFGLELLRRAPAAPLPLPQTVEMAELRGVAPVPRLYLAHGADETGARHHLARLRFGYADHELHALPPSDQRTLEVGGALVRIWRDPVSEAQAVERLQSLGFEALADQGQQDLVFLSFSQDDRMEGLLRWESFLGETLPELMAQGWQVQFAPDFQMEFLQAADWGAEIEEGNGWFDLRFDFEIGGQRLPLLPLIAQVLERFEPHRLPERLALEVGPDKYLSVSAEQIRPVLDILYELYDRGSLDAGGALRLSRFDAPRLAELEESGAMHLQWQGGVVLRQLGRRLKDFQGIQPVVPPHGLRAELRNYQQLGLNWLQFLREYGFGGVLADDMGLGKTVQTLAHLLLEKEQGRLDRPALIIAPTSLMSNWRREAEQFAPALKVLTLQGLDRHTRFNQIAQADLVLSTYPLLARDEERLLAQGFHYLVLDEAQIVKNPRAKAAKVVRQIDARHRLCLTGTPMENHLGELWALFDFLMPGFLGDAARFQRLFRTPIEKHGDGDRRAGLARRVAPFMLRRTKAEVVKELPAKTEIIRSVSLDTRQAALYESIRLSMEKKVRDAIASKGLARSHITILDALLKLRQACCDPGLLKLRQAQTVKESAKMDLLMQLLPEMVEEGRRILLFSQFTQMLGIIEQALVQRGIAYTKLTGQTRDRDAVIEAFKRGDAAVFLISLKAGGVGLNLAEADTVIHYDPWWNPAAENQATDRAHRIGQDKAVFVYKLITENTVEEKILALQAKKQALAQGIYAGARQEVEKGLSADDLKRLFEPL